MVNKKMDRRSFLKAAAMGSSALLPLSVSKMSLAANQFSDYKTMVCVFLPGGNDAYSMLVPTTGPELAEYKRYRANVVQSNLQTLEIVPDSQLSGGLGFISQMQGMKDLYNDGVLAIQGNVGSLVQPVTKAQLRSKSVDLPSQLFSHNSQQATWQAGGEPNQTSGAGWGGRMMKFLDQNNTDYNFMQNVSFSGQNTWQSGGKFPTYVTAPGGLPELGMYTDRRYGNTPRIIRKAEVSKFFREGEYTNIHKASFNRIVAGLESNGSMERAALASSGFTSVDGLSETFSAIANLIKASERKGVNRQLYFVNFGGWDTHKNQLEQHTDLAQNLSATLAGFYQALVANGLESKVTTFTMSDFGRNLTPNSSGTDHGWASHQFIMGKHVNGGSVYGDIAEQKYDSPLLRGGVPFPTTSNEQMFSSLAQWFGVESASDRETLFPNLRNFSQGAVNPNPNYF